MLNRFLLLVALLLVGAAVTGCNTIEGAGKDVKAAGGAVEKAAKSTKTY
jgi:predicted small secreted protein